MRARLVLPARADIDTGWLRNSFIWHVLWWHDCCVCGTDVLQHPRGKGQCRCFRGSCARHLLHSYAIRKGVRLGQPNSATPRKRLCHCVCACAQSETKFAPCQRAADMHAQHEDELPTTTPLEKLRI